MTITVHFNEENSRLIKDYAKANNIGALDFVKETILKKVRTDMDLKDYYQRILNIEKDV